MLSQCIHISYYHIFPTTQCHGHHYICIGRNRGSERSSNLPKGKRKQNCFSSPAQDALGRHHRLLLHRRTPRCWEVGVCGHTASWGRAGSQQTWCLPPSCPHGPLQGTEGPSPGKETPWPGPSPLCGSKLPILPPGPAGLRSGAWSSPGDPDVPLQGRRRAERLQTP